MEKNSWVLFRKNPNPRPSGFLAQPLNPPTHAIPFTFTMLPSPKNHTAHFSLSPTPTSASDEVEIGVQRPPVVAHRSLVGTGYPSLSLILSVSALCRTASLLFSPSLILTFSLFSMEEEGDKRNKRKEKKEVGSQQAASA